MRVLLAIIAVLSPLCARAGDFEALKAAAQGWVQASPNILHPAEACPPKEGEPAASVSGQAVPQDPSWFVMEGEGPEFEQAKEKLLSAVRIVADTPAGAALMDVLNRGGGRVILRPNGSFLADPSEFAFTAGPELVNGRTPRQLAPLAAHEIAHLSQFAAGLGARTARGVMEAGAFRTQCRVWVESGGKTEDSDFKKNLSNAADMWAWLEFPESTVTALASRAGLSWDVSSAGAKAYWNKVLSDERTWRAAWTAKFPQGRSSREAAIFMLEQAAGFSDPEPEGEISPWLPDLIERGAALKPGASLSLSGAPSAKDLRLLDSKPYPGVVSRDGKAWTLERR